MVCPFCEEQHETQVEMELIESIHDYFDPGNFYGHGEYKTISWQCPDCFELLDFEKENKEVEIEDVVFSSLIQ